MGAYLRGRLFIAGVGDDTSVGDALDVLTVVVMDTPVDPLRKWRGDLDRALLASHARSGTATDRVPDRKTWGLAPDQIAATERFMASHGRRR